ncbi:MgtC/SapB family protein [Pseudohaliea rubra]|uniref:MgtC family n=1 Tax=Pseudohaliea rubra DSM 19751 TaxID=1265313 RepID=A0A095VVR5_9GAMM|nr:MgtC/SapB family protein [Pseudohaliea rubra]KGE05088.1 MgtC family [Pseudohaliea rubra DSM 19751]
MDSLDPDFLHLAVALGIGLLFGAERGWQQRSAPDGGRVAGIRTFGLMGLLGGAAGMLTGEGGALVLGFVFLGLVAMLTVAHVLEAQQTPDISITSLAAGLLVFLLGALATRGEPGLAAAAAVVATLLLSYKPTLHRWLGALDVKELRAGLLMLLITVVVLPVLPDRGFGPWQALNPYAIWWMVVLIAGISFVGYFAVRLAGTRRGLLVTGLAGGLASSTALTLQLSRAARGNGEAVPSLASGVLLACGTMLPRMVLVATLLNGALLEFLLLPALAMGLVVYLPILFYWHRARSARVDLPSPLKNPFEWRAALGFGALLALIMLLGEALRQAFGERGIIALAAASGITDVDAITLSLARMSGSELATEVAAFAMILAAAANNAAKGLLAWGLGGRALGLRVGTVLLASSLVGLAAALPLLGGRVLP